MGRVKGCSTSSADATGHFTSGMDVEVKCEDEGFRGAWYEAVVKSCNSKKRTCVVRYTSLLCDDDLSCNLEEYVLVDNMRPRPPRDGARFYLHEVVDAYHNDGWWGGVIAEIHESPDGETVQGYVVCFPATREVVNFKPEDVRAQFFWSRRKWFKMDENKQEGNDGAKNTFLVGNSIEVTRDTEIYGATWFTGKVDKVINNSIFIVEYKELEKDNGEHLKEIVHIQYIRPPPPRHAHPNFQLQHEVEAFYKGSWYAGVVVKVLSHPKYAVRSKFLPDKEMEFDISNLRPSRYWVNGKWVSRALLGKHTKSFSRKKLQIEMSSSPITQELQTVSTPNDSETEAPNMEGVYSLPRMKSKKSKSSEDYFKVMECCNMLMGCSESSSKVDRKNDPPIESRNTEILNLPIEASNLHDSESHDGLNGNRSSLECQVSTDFSASFLNGGKTDTPMLEHQTGFSKLSKKTKRERTPKVKELSTPIDHPTLSHGLSDSKSAKSKTLPQKRKFAVPPPLQTKEMERQKQKDLSRRLEKPNLVSNDMPRVFNCQGENTQGKEFAQTDENSDSPFDRTDLSRGYDKPTFVSNDTPQASYCQGLSGDDMLVICEPNQWNISTVSPLQMCMGPPSPVAVSLDCPGNMSIDCSPIVSEKTAEKRIRTDSGSNMSPAHEVSTRVTSPFNFVEQPKMPGDQTILESQSGPLLSSLVDATVAEKTPLPFTKKHPMWKYLETLEGFQSIPQDPHFRSLEQYADDFREGMAIGLMVTFYNMVKKINLLNISDPESTYDNLLKGLATLENNGFDVQPLHSRIERLLETKRKQAESLMGTEAVKEKISSLLEQKGQLDCEIGALDKEVTELQEKVTRLCDERKKVVMMVRSVESDISELRTEIEAATEIAALAGNQFSALVSSPL